MIAFVWNILLAVVWAAATEKFTLGNITIGFLFGYAVMSIMPPLPGAAAYYLQVREMVGFVTFFVRELVLANIKVAVQVVSPLSRMKPGVVGVALDDMTDTEITFLANLITLTPGTLSLDVSDDRRTLYIHAMDIRDAERFQREIRDGFARRVMEIMR